jgi:quercetin dioxygenase-like cupin family protein
MQTNTNGSAPQLINPKSYVKTLAFPAVHLLDRGEGDLVQPLDLEFQWKLQGPETGFQFSVYEMVLAPDKKVPLHIHPFSEFFYVLEGRLDVMTLDAEGALKWVELRSGQCVNAPATTPHGMKNRSEKAVKFLSVANFEHQKPFDDYQGWLATEEGALANGEQKVETLMKIFDEYKIQFFDIDGQ